MLVGRQIFSSKDEWVILFPGNPGLPELDLFEKFLISVLEIMAINNLCGDQYDRQRILLWTTYLEGMALEFFREQIERPMYLGQYQWTFSEAVCATYLRFVRSGGARRAALQYDRAE